MYPTTRVGIIYSEEQECPRSALQSAQRGVPEGSLERFWRVHKLLFIGVLLHTPLSPARPRKEKNQRLVRQRPP